MKRGCHIQGAHVPCIGFSLLLPCQVLHTTKSLTDVNLSRNHFDYTGAAALGTAVRSNDSLTTLDVSRNALGFRYAKVHWP